MPNKESFNIDFDNEFKNFDIDLDLSGTVKATQEVAKAAEIEYDATTMRKSRRSTKIKRYSKHIYRRAYSETQLLDLMTEPFKKGYSYHFLTGGDVDSLSYLKIILRQYDLDYCLFSTWCMAQEDIFQFRDWLEDGRIKKVDAYMGEIFPNSYKIEYAMLVPLIEEYGGRVCVCKNHSKVFAGYNKERDFYFIIQTSANVNTNPRIENGCITIDRACYEFYKDFYDSLESYVRDNKEKK